MIRSWLGGHLGVGAVGGFCAVGLVGGATVGHFCLSVQKRSR
jgi:hypothetical protein